MLEIRLTPLAAGFAKAKSSIPALQDRTREEIDKLLEDGLSDPMELILHTFQLGGVEYICYPKDGAIEVDTCSREKMEKMKSGPLKGKHWYLPVPDSE
jgi:hypothetical protein